MATPFAICSTCSAKKSPQENVKCQACKTSMRSVVGASCCGTLHPNSSNGHNIFFWDNVKNEKVFDNEVTQPMKIRFLKIKEQYPTWTEHCLEDVLAIDKRIVKEATAIYKTFAEINDITTTLDRKNHIFSDVLNRVKTIADNFCLRRFSTLATRFSKFGACRRMGLTPTKGKEIVIDFGNKVPWGQDHFYERMKRGEAEKGNTKPVKPAKGPWPINFGEDTLKIIEGMNFNTTQGTWERPTTEFDSDCFQAVTYLVSKLLTHIDRESLSEGSAIIVIVGTKGAKSPARKKRATPSPKKRRTPLKNVNSLMNSDSRPKQSKQRKPYNQPTRHPHRQSTAAMAEDSLRTPSINKVLGNTTATTPENTPRTALANEFGGTAFFSNPHALAYPTPLPHTSVAPDSFLSLGVHDINVLNSHDPHNTASSSDDHTSLHDFSSSLLNSDPTIGIGSKRNRRESLPARALATEFLDDVGDDGLTTPELLDTSLSDPLGASGFEELNGFLYPDLDYQPIKSEFNLGDDFDQYLPN
eukprot:m.40132 g.40132  ORF g.40132 m.40132 type:complete len:527 (-) comp18396_c0_seq1:70-1650(-)